jgi:hypothetical protein
MPGTPNAAATSATARFDPAIAAANSLRNRAVSRDRDGIALVVSVNDRRQHCIAGQTKRRLRHHSTTCCPDAGRSLTCTSGRSFTRDECAPHSGHAQLDSTVSITT